MALPRLVTRAFEIAIGEVADLRPELLLARALVAPLPRLTFGRLRAGLYRAAGLDVGEGTLILGTLELGGQAGAGGRLHIGARCMLNTPLFLDLNDDIFIGDEVNIGHHSTIVTSTHLVGAPVRRAGLRTTGPVRLEEGCWLGANVTVLPNVIVGRGAVVAAGAVVSSDVAPNTMVGGVPAREIKQLPEHHRDTCAPSVAL